MKRQQKQITKESFEDLLKCQQKQIIKEGFEGLRKRQQEQVTYYGILESVFELHVLSVEMSMDKFK